MRLMEMCGKSIFLEINTEYTEHTEYTDRVPCSVRNLQFKNIRLVAAGLRIGPALLASGHPILNLF